MGSSTHGEELVRVSTVVTSLDGKLGDSRKTGVCRCRSVTEEDKKTVGSGSIRGLHGLIETQDTVFTSFVKRRRQHNVNTVSMFLIKQNTEL